MSDEHSGRVPHPVQSSAPPLSGLELLKWIAFIAVVYFGIARLSLLLAFQHTAVSPLRPPAGIGLAAILLLGYRAFIRKYGEGEIARYAVISIQDNGVRIHADVKSKIFEPSSQLRRSAKGPDWVSPSFTELSDNTRA